jgi:hypothetical protein
MSGLPPNSSQGLRQLLLDLLWKQWSALGVAGSGDPEYSHAIDIEALVLMTCTQGRHDARLFDEMLDWLWTHGSWVNVQRLRNIHRRLSLGDARVLGAVAELLSKRAVLSKWKALARTNSRPIVASSEPLFIGEAGRGPLVFGEADPVFLRWGFWRGPGRLRQLSRTPSPLPAANLLFKLRALFGVQARCDVLLWLLSHQGGRPAEIARATLYFPKTVEDTLKDLTASGLVREARPGRERHYGLDPREWAFLITWKKPAGFPEWIDWPRHFAVVEKFFAVYSRTDLSDRLLASELRTVMEDLQATLADGKLLSAFAVSRKHTGLQFGEALTEDLHRLLAT